jgi:hypothetical protein
MKHLALFPVRRSKPRLPPAWSQDCHPFTPGDDGVYCVHCALPASNQRHGGTAA